MLTEKTITKLFWSKMATKRFLAEHTSFKYPLTVTGVHSFEDLIPSIKTLKDGDWVLKPNVGRKSKGVVLFSKNADTFNIFPDTAILSFEEFSNRIDELIGYKNGYPKVQNRFQHWFVEEWIKPHSRFQCFTDYPKCSPILRFCGRPRIHFIGLSPIKKDVTGLSVAGWEHRKYIWLDLTGKVRDATEMDLTGVDKQSINKVPEKSFPNPPVGTYIERIPEIVDKINAEIVPKIRLYRESTWCCDGIFDEKDEFKVIELNHDPGLQFRGFKW